MPSEQLLPCPFDGGTEVIVGSGSHDGPYVRCFFCDTYIFGDSESEVIEKWNTRAIPPAPAAVSEGALPALDSVIENDPALKEAFEIQQPKSYVRRQAAAVAIDAWTDAGGHVWQLRPGINCVECPHCLFTFAAEHRVAPDGYDCPNCEGCPDAPAAATPCSACGDGDTDMKYHNHDKSSGAGLDCEHISVYWKRDGIGGQYHCVACQIPFSLVPTPALQPVAGKCGLCGHRGMVGVNGWCRASDPAYQTRFVECGCKCEFSVPKAHTAANCEVCAAQQEASVLGTPYSVGGHSVPTAAEDEHNPLNEIEVALISIADGVNPHDAVQKAFDIINRERLAIIQKKARGESRRGWTSRIKS